MVCTLTNGGADATETPLTNAGVDRYVERVLTVETAERWEPSPEPYRQAAETLRIEPDQAALVAVHSWDIHGARQPGLAAGWCSRLEGSYPTIFDAADVAGPDLITVVDGLLTLPTGGTSSD